MSWQEEEAIKLPDTAEEIIRRLSAVNNENTLVERLYPQIAKHRGAELVPQGVIVMLLLAISEFAKYYPTPIGKLLILFVPKWIDALIDNKEAAEFAKSRLKTIQEDVRTRCEAITPPRVEPEGPVENYELYVAVRKVAKIFFAEVNKEKRKKKIDLHVGHRDDGVNPFYNQTHSGLFVEYYYGSPSKIWTPWGYWKFEGSVYYSGNPWPPILERFLNRLGATEFMPEQNTDYGVVGPVYAIHKIDKTELPEPKLREPQNYLEYEIAHKAWDNMTHRYKAEQTKRRAK